jgi:hypothetical protein
MSDAINGEGAGDAVKREIAVLIGVNSKFGGAGFLIAKHIRILLMIARTLR